jgi:hypothetical protein
MIGPTPVPSSKHHQHEQTQSWNGPSGVADADHQERAVTGVTDEDPSGIAMRGSNCHRGGGINQMLQQQVPDTGWAYPVGRIGQIGRTGSCCAPLPKPRQRATLNEQDQSVGYQGQRQHQHQAHDDRRVEEAARTKIEELAKRSATYENCNAHQGRCSTR